MRKILSSVGELWVGYHQKLGPVIYNKRSQRGLPDTQVRLYKVNECATGTFLKELVRDKLISPDDALWDKIQPAISAYIAAIRITHCYKCKQDLDSVEFSLCNKCGWILCSCGACGCDSRRRF